MQITSATNPKVQRVRALLEQRKTRHAEQAFVVEGVRLIEEALASNWAIETVFHAGTRSERGELLLQALTRTGAELHETTDALLRQMSDTETPQGLLAIVKRSTPAIPEASDFLLIADALRDPGNLGTLLRTAAAAGVQGILLAPGTVDAFAPKVVRSAMGAHFRLPIVEMTWEAITALVKMGLDAPLCVVGSVVSGGSEVWQSDLKRPVALIVSNEAEGMGAKAQALADINLTIPMPGASESLNAAVAAGILMFEVVRQRREGNLV